LNAANFLTINQGEKIWHDAQHQYEGIVQPQLRRHVPHAVTKVGAMVATVAIVAIVLHIRRMAAVIAVT